MTPKKIGQVDPAAAKCAVVRNAGASPRPKARKAKAYDEDRSCGSQPAVRSHGLLYSSACYPAGSPDRGSWALLRLLPCLRDTHHWPRPCRIFRNPSHRCLGPNYQTGEPRGRCGNNWSSGSLSSNIHIVPFPMFERSQRPGFVHDLVASRWNGRCFAAHLQQWLPDHRRSCTESNPRRPTQEARSRNRDAANHSPWNQPRLIHHGPPSFSAASGSENKEKSMLKILPGLLLLSISATTSASSPGAWARLEQEVTRKCIEVSEYRRPKVSNPIVFDDRNGNVAVIVTGSFPRSSTKGTTVTSLCLYDRHARTAALQEAPGWSASRRVPR